MPNKKRKKLRNRSADSSSQKKLLNRFYEPLVLLHALDRNSETRISRCPSEDLMTPRLELRELRRTFLDQLAYTCDYVKGGDTVTAITLEAHPSCVTFWIASNTEPRRSVEFLREILGMMGGISPPSPIDDRRTLEERIAIKSVNFNRKRIDAYRNLLREPLMTCLRKLSESGKKEDEELAKWLSNFQQSNADLKRLMNEELDEFVKADLKRDLDKESQNLCRLCYVQRGSNWMRELQKHIGNGPAEPGGTDSRRDAFSTVRHLLGRLGSQFKAARILASVSERIPSLFVNFKVRQVCAPKPPSLPPPTSVRTTLDGIITRMLPKESTALPRYREALNFMDAKFGILKRIIDLYKNNKFRPRVHAELILLEFFYQRQLPFVDDDRFIGCSKPACYCCYHYICAHPGGFAPPASHGVRYLNWRPPDLDSSAGDSEIKHQRDMLNHIVTKIRRDALRQIDQRRGPSPWQPDSTTGITHSLNQDESTSQHQTAQYNQSGGSHWEDPWLQDQSHVDSDCSDSGGGVLL